jgi:hypothetical protein
VARAKSNRGQSWSVRYYLCSGDQIAWRIPNTLLKDLAAGKLALPQFAGAKQKVLEAFVGGARGAPVLLDACGSYFSFASDGSLDVHPEAEALSSIIEGARPRRVQAHVIDIGPTVRHRRWVKDRTWRATATMLRAVRIDLSGTVQPGAKNYRCSNGCSKIWRRGSLLCRSLQAPSRKSWRPSSAERGCAGSVRRSWLFHCERLPTTEMVSGDRHSSEAAAGASLIIDPSRHRSLMTA